MGERPGSILFLCGMNAIRSPMAENLARYLFPGIFTQSAGVRCGVRDPFVVAVMDEIGLDLSNHNPKDLEDLEDDYFDLIITLAPEAHHKALEFTRTSAVDVEYWPTQDPSLATGSRDQILDSYRQVRDQLKMKLTKRFSR